MENISIIEMGLIVEIKFNNETLNKFKTERGKNNFIIKSAKTFLDNLKTFNNVSICNIDNKLKHYLTEINDFKYSASNQCDKTENYTVYRLFGFSILGLDYNNRKYSFINEMYKTNKFDINIQNTNFGKYDNKNK